MSDFGGAISGIGGFIAAGQEAAGLNQAAGFLTDAANLEKTNVKIEQQSVGLQEYGLQREVERTRGATRAEQFGAGFTFHGSGVALDMSSVEQGALGNSLILNQGAINEQGYQIQADSFLAQAAIDKAQASAAQTSGLFGMISGFMGLL